VTREGDPGMPSSEVLCVGEVLWDALPAGLFLGGAPFNVACHLRAAGLPVAMASRVGADHLGDEVRRRAAAYDIAVDLVQVDAALPTGFVRVTLDEAGDATYDIVAPAAWDAIAPTEALLRRAADARAIVFGTLAQRHPVARATIERLWDTEALLVFDANLRAPHDDPAVVRRSLRRADVVKVTERELSRIAAWFDLPGDARPGAPLLPTVAGAGRVVRLRHGVRHARAARRRAVAARRVDRAPRLRGGGAGHRWVPATRSSPCCWRGCSAARTPARCCSTPT
jgi:fructokinase